MTAFSSKATSLGPTKQLPDFVFLNSYTPRAERPRTRRLAVTVRSPSWSWSHECHPRESPTYEYIISRYSKTPYHALSEWYHTQPGEMTTVSMKLLLPTSQQRKRKHLLKIFQQKYESNEHKHYSRPTPQHVQGVPPRRHSDGRWG